MTGDAEMQPVEGVDALDDLADSLVLDPKGAKAPNPDDDEGDDSEESEEVESEEEESEAEEEAEDDPTVKLKHDGKEIELKLSEALNLAQQGYDYSVKTMAVAEDRKAVAAEREQVTHAHQQASEYVQETLHRLEAYSQFMQSQVGEPPSTDMLAYDTNGYLIAKEQYQARKGQLQEARGAIQTLQDEQARQRQAWIAERAEIAERELKDTLPGWNDDMLNDLAGYTGKFGLTTQTADMALLVPGFWQLAHKAKAYEAIQERKSQMKPTETLAKVSKPSASNTTGKVAERAKREANFNKNPSVDALAALLR